MTARFAQISRFAATAAGTVMLLASGQAFASTVVVSPAPVYVAPAKVVVVKPAPKVVYQPVVMLPTVVVKPSPRAVYLATRPVYVVR